MLIFSSGNFAAGSFSGILTVILTESLNLLFQLKKFLHNQNGCGRVVGLKCDECEKEKKTPEVQISSQNDSQMELIEIKKELEDLKNNYEKVVESEAKLKEELTLEKEKNRETILTLKAENAANERVIQQLLDKLTPISSNEDRQNAVEEAPIDIWSDFPIWKPSNPSV